MFENIFNGTSKNLDVHMYSFNVPLTFVTQTDGIYLLLIELYNIEYNQVWRKRMYFRPKTKEIYGLSILTTNSMIRGNHFNILLLKDYLILIYYNNELRILGFLICILLSTGWNIFVI